MANRTYSERVIVLRKTRLREADLVLTMLASDGRQVRAVAKGALKPSGSFASRLELYAQSQVLFVEGRSLDIVKEARLVHAHERLRFDYVRSICAAPMIELLAIATQDELPVPKLFEMTEAALDALERAPEDRVALVMTAFLLKAACMLGFRPSFDVCTECGAEQTDDRPTVRFSYAAGGVVCSDCAAYTPSVVFKTVNLFWAKSLVYATFMQIIEGEMGAAPLFDLMAFAQRWIKEHIGELRSMSFVLAEYSDTRR